MNTVVHEAGGVSGMDVEGYWAGVFLSHLYGEESGALKYDRAARALWDSSVAMAGEGSFADLGFEVIYERVEIGSGSDAA